MDNENYCNGGILFMDNCIPKNYIEHMNKFYIKCIEHKKLIFKFCMDKCAGACIGLVEGMGSGALTGLSVTGKGWWGFALLGQAFAAPIGIIIGAFAGSIAGSVLGRKEVMSLMQNYRECFGKLKNMTKVVNNYYQTPVTENPDKSR